MFASVIVPVFNTENYLNKCFESLQNQTCKDFEIILIDDGSTDDSAKLCDDFAKKHKDVLVLHQMNSGASVARNEGLKQAKGQWILFLDSDDFLDENTIAVLKKAVENNPSDFYMFNTQRVLENDQKAEKLIFFAENTSTCFESGKENEKGNEKGNEKERFLYLFNSFTQYKDGWEVWGKLFSNKIIQDNNLKFSDRKPIFAEDYTFTFQYILHVSKICKLCDILYFYRMNSNSTLSKVKQQDTLFRMYYVAEECLLYWNRIRKNRKLEKDFYMLFFQIMNFHIQYKTSEVSEEEIKQALTWIENNTKYGKTWLQQVRDHRGELAKYQLYKNWIL